MTNEEKAKEIVKSCMSWWEDADYTTKDIEDIMTNACKKMAEWKDSQLTDKDVVITNEEKAQQIARLDKDQQYEQKLIDKDCEIERLEMMLEELKKGGKL